MLMDRSRPKTPSYDNADPAPSRVETRVDVAAIAAWNLRQQMARAAYYRDTKPAVATGKTPAQLARQSVRERAQRARRKTEIEAQEGK